MKFPAVFLDRDNTVIARASEEHDAHGDMGDPDQVKLLKGAASAIASMRGLGYKIVIVTSQGGVARGKYTEDDVDAVHQRINGLLRKFSNTFIDRFYYCPYHPEGTVEAYRHEDHPWRKPAPGMWFQAADDLSIDLSKSWSIGDMMRDVQAGASAGTRTILLADGEPAEHGMGHVPEYTCRDLIESVRIMAAKKRPEPAEAIALGGGRERNGDAELEVTEKLSVGEGDGEKEGDKACGDGRLSGDLPTSSTKGSVRRERRFVPMDQADSPVAGVGRGVGGGVGGGGGIGGILSGIRRGAMLVSEEVVDRAHRGKVRGEGEGEVGDGEVELLDEGGVKAQAAEDGGGKEGGARGGVGSEVPGRRSEQLLRQILQQLKDQAAAAQDFSMMEMLAMVLQLIVLTCVAGAFLMGSEDMFSFLRWLGMGIVLQLGVVTMLLFYRR